MERILEIDIETYSDVDLIKCGVYAYADSPAFEVLLFAYSTTLGWSHYGTRRGDSGGRSGTG